MIRLTTIHLQKLSFLKYLIHLNANLSLFNFFELVEAVGEVGERGSSESVRCLSLIHI